MPAKQKKLREDRLLLKVGLEAERLRIVISKKVAKQAVKRNRIRRVLREAAKKELGPANEGRGLVLVVLPGFEALRIEDAQKILRRLFHKAFA